MDETLANFCRMRVPRYTSYPTAPHFESAFSPDRYNEWLHGIDPSTRISLYIHVPFCRALCHYCGCNTKVANRDSPIISYAGLLEREIEMVANAIGRRQPVAHIHWGGGTPGILPSENFHAINDAIHDRFDLSDIREHAIEIDPRYVDKPFVARLVDAGINRVSLGVQDFSPTVQKLIGRVQPVGVVAQATQRLRSAGIEAINFDLMYGLPGQTVHSVERSVEISLTMEPSRVAYFGYAHVPWAKKNQVLIDETTLPGPEERFEQAQRAAEVLKKRGYVRIGFDHYARPDDPMVTALTDGGIARNFQGYTDDAGDALIGLGASAIGKLPSGYAQNAPGVPEYRAAIEAGQFATVRGKALSADDKARGAVIEQLMCSMSVNVGAVAGHYQVATDSLRPNSETLKVLEDVGFLVRDGVQLNITDRGRPFARIAASAFDAYLSESDAKYSEAI